MPRIALDPSSPTIQASFRVTERDWNEFQSAVGARVSAEVMRELLRGYVRRKKNLQNLRERAKKRA